MSIELFGYLLGSLFSSSIAGIVYTYIFYRLKHRYNAIKPENRMILWFAVFTIIQFSIARISVLFSSYLFLSSIIIALASFIYFKYTK